MKCITCTFLSLPGFLFKLQITRNTHPNIRESELFKGYSFLRMCLALRRTLILRKERLRSLTFTVGWGHLTVPLVGCNLQLRIAIIRRSLPLRLLRTSRNSSVWSHFFFLDEENYSQDIWWISSLLLLNVCCSLFWVWNSAGFRIGECIFMSWDIPAEVS